MNPEVRAALKQKHQQNLAFVCRQDGQMFPCDTVNLLEELAAAEARAEQAETCHSLLQDDYRELMRDVEVLRKRAEQAERDTEAALMTVGAFRAAIEDLFSKATGESGEDGFILAYVLPVGTVHRAIGLARGTDAGGKWMAEMIALRSRLATVEAALKRLYLWVVVCHPSRTFHDPSALAAAVEQARAALAATPAEGVAKPDEPGDCCACDGYGKERDDSPCMICGGCGSFHRSIDPCRVCRGEARLPEKPSDRREQRRQHGGEG